MNLKSIALATLIAITAAACGDQTKAPTPQANNSQPLVQPQVPLGGKTEAQKPVSSIPVKPSQSNTPGSQNLGRGVASQHPTELPSDTPIAPPPKIEARSTSEVPLRPATDSANGAKLGNIEYRSSETTPDAEIEQAIVESLDGDRIALQQTRYYYDRIDLNGDGKPEALVYLSGFYTCGTGGCKMLVLEQSGQRYQVVSKMTLVNAPVIVSSERSAGWNDLVLEVAGGGTVKHYAQMKFDGSTYPVNPSTAPEVAPNTINGTAVLNDSVTADGGIALQGEG
ncbi:MAG: hypothetical protein KME11_00775 [Timaviella obliquedivisa GSE-PSE-MK23-08B]|jgi:hypothetical protein|nr:hypothetical protein [Timaviella obliquedivisa GSE-PSE-MK23-08B]